MNKSIAVCVLAAGLAHVASAEAGAPAWCSGIKETEYNLDHLTKGKASEIVETIVDATCRPTPEATAAAAKIEAARAEWSKKLGMTDADWADAVAWANEGGGLHEAKFAGTKDLNALSPIDQYLVIKEGMVEDYGGGFKESDYIADALEQQLTEVGRFGFVRTCTGEDATPVERAQCQGDIDALDAAKFAVQLRGDTKYPAKIKMSLRLELYELSHKVAKHEEAKKKLFAKDAAYKQLWTAAAKGRAEFAAGLGKNTELLALATKMDSAQWSKSRKQYEGCEATTKAAFEKVIVDKLPASSIKGLKKDTPVPYYANREHGSDTFGNALAPILADIPELSLVTGPYSQCRHAEVRDGGDHLSHYLQSLHAVSPAMRGPRRAALIAMLHEKITLDDMTAKIDYPKVTDPYVNNDNVISDLSTAGGVVASTRVEGDQIVVSFAKQSGKEQQCIQSHHTNKLTRIYTDGTLGYELVCDKYGMVTYDDTPRDEALDKVYAPLVKKGVQFSATGPVLVAVWPNKDAKVPSHVLGVAVK